MSKKEAATVDSLMKFRHNKRRFSFTNKGSNNDSEPDNDEEEEGENNKVVEKKSDDEQTSPVIALRKRSSTGGGSSSANRPPKGSAILKESKKKAHNSSLESSTTSISSNDEKLDEKTLQKLYRMFPLIPRDLVKSHLHKTHGDAKKCVDLLVVENEKHAKSSGDDDAEKLDEMHLHKLYKMFPQIPRDLVKKELKRAKNDVKKCIDSLVVEDEKWKKSTTASDDDDVDIEEWSDGDEMIRARNQKLKQMKRKRLESTSSVEIVAGGDDDERTSSSSNSKKARIISDDDGSDIDVVKKKKHEKRINTTNEEEEEEEGEEAVEGESSDDDKKKKSKKHKKDKRKSKKKSHGSDDEEPEDQDDDEFMRGMSGGDDSDSDLDDQDRIPEPQRQAILALFNDASMEEIQSLMNVSEKRIQGVLDMRPFADFADLQAKLAANRSFLTLIDSAKDVIFARSMVNKLLEKCESISKKMEQQVGKLIASATGDDDSKQSSTALEINFQPKTLSTDLSLKPYQLVGLNWLCLMHKENLNGILADEMGLGKTCQTIAFLAYLLEKKERGLHLIVVPPSTLDNWIREITAWCPDFYFTVYQGSLQERKKQRHDILNNRFKKPLNAILTTYGLLHSTPNDKAFFSKKLKFHYCIFDEAHMLKNMNSIRYQSLIKIQSKRKLLLTGTPLQNNLVELMSLLYFVMPDMFNHQVQYVNKIFSSKTAGAAVESRDTFYQDKIQQAKGIMKPFVLRRLKCDVLKQLPKKIEEIVYCKMTQRQQKEYASLISYYKQKKVQLLKSIAEEKKEALAAAKMAKAKKDQGQEMEYELLNLGVGKAPAAATSSSPTKADVGTPRRRNSDVIIDKGDEFSSANILMELRKAANHPLLRRTVYDNEKLKKMARLIMKESSPDTVYEYVLEDMSVMNDFQLHKLCALYKGLKSFELDKKTLVDSGKFTVLTSILEEKKEKGDRVLLFSQFVIMLDIIEEYLKIKGYKYLRLDGSTAVDERQDMIDNYNDDEDIFVFLLTTRAGGVGINLTAANVVILHDIDYNPYNDKQAEDRCHRVGQTKEVQVYKLLSKDSIDETMLKIQNKKLELGADLSGEKAEESKSDMVSMLKEALNL